MNDGYVCLNRCILEHQIFASEKLLKIWVWCLCKANYKTKFVPLKVGKGTITVEVKRGQFIFGRNKAEEELFIDGSTIYKCMLKLQSFDSISIESNNQYSIVTICNFDTYNTQFNTQVTSNEQVSNNQVTSNEQPSNNQVTSNEQVSNTTNKDNKDNKDNKEKKVKKNKINDIDSPTITPKEFFDSEINNNLNHLEIEKYKYLVEYFMNGKGKCYLNLKEQLSFNEFIKLINKAKGKNILLMDIFGIGVNTPAYLKSKNSASEYKTSVYLTINTWVNNQKPNYTVKNNETEVQKMVTNIAENKAKLHPDTFKKQ